MQEGTIRDSSLEIPPDIICTITSQIMTDPVILMGSGNTYEREALLKWLATNKRDPLTNEAIVDETIAPNRTVKRMIVTFLEKHQKINPDITHETYLPESLIQTLINSIEKNEVKMFSDTLQKDSRLLTNELKDKKNLLILAAEFAGLEILEIVLTQLADKIRDFPSIKADNGRAFFGRVSHRLGLEGARLMAKVLHWKQMDFQDLLISSTKENNLTIAKIVLSLDAIATPALLNQTYLEQKREMVKILISAEVSLEEEDSQGNDFCMRTIQDNETEITLFLLTHVCNRINVNHYNKAKQSTLHLAVIKKQADVVKALLNQPKIAIDARDSDGNNALHLAASMGNKAIVALFMKHSLSIKDKNSHQKTAIQLARENGHPELANWMEEKHRYKKVKPFLKPMKQEMSSLTQENQQLRNEVNLLKNNAIYQKSWIDKFSIFNNQYSETLVTMAEAHQQREMKTQQEKEQRQRALEQGKQNPLQSVLIEALLKGDLEWVKKLQMQGASLLYPNKEELYPLVAAVYSTRFEVVQYVQAQLKEEAIKQWAEIDPDVALEKIAQETPAHLPEKATYGDIGNFYINNAGKWWCDLYDKRVLAKEHEEQWYGVNWQSRGGLDSVRAKQRWVRKQTTLSWEDSSGRQHMSLSWPSRKTHEAVVNLIISQLNALKNEVMTHARRSTVSYQL